MLIPNEPPSAQCSPQCVGCIAFQIRNLRELSNLTSKNLGIFSIFLVMWCDYTLYSTMGRTSILAECTCTRLYHQLEGEQLHFSAIVDHGRQQDPVSAKYVFFMLVLLLRWKFKQFAILFINLSFQVHATILREIHSTQLHNHLVRSHCFPFGFVSCLY